MTAFQNSNVKFVNINTAEFDSYKVGAIPVADAGVALEQLSDALAGTKVTSGYSDEIATLKQQWEAADAGCVLGIGVATAVWIANTGEILRVGVGSAKLRPPERRFSTCT